MPNKIRVFQNGNTYHVFSRGVEKRRIFLDDIDRRRFLSTLLFYQQENIFTKFSLTNFEIKDRKAPLRFDLICYCLMPNHFHLMLKQNSDKGISQGISQLLNSYVRYFNTRHKRVGTLFQGKFKSVDIITDEQYIHLARYIFINPYISGLTDNITNYQWSAYQEYVSSSPKLCNQKNLKDYFKNKNAMIDFVLDYADYKKSTNIIEDISHYI